MSNEGGRDDIMDTFSDLKRGAEKVEEKKLAQEIFELEHSDSEDLVRKEVPMFLMQVERGILDELSDSDLDKIDAGVTLDAEVLARCEAAIEKMITEKRSDLDGDEVYAPEKKEHIWGVFIDAIKRDLKSVKGVEKIMYDFFVKKGLL